MKRPLLCCMTLCLLVCLNCMTNLGCGGINNTAASGTPQGGFLYAIGLNAASLFTYSAFDVEPTSGTLTLLGSGERTIAGLTGWVPGTSFIGSNVNQTSDGHLLTTVIDSGTAGTAVSLSADFSSGANAGLLTEASSQAINPTRMYGIYMRYGGDGFVICHDGSPGFVPACDDIAFFRVTNGVLGAPVYTAIDEGVSYEYYGGSVVLSGNMVYMVVLNAAFQYHILAYRVNTSSGALTLVADIDLNAAGIPAAAAKTQLSAYGNVRNNQYAAVVWESTGPTNYFFVACNLDGSGVPTLAGIYDTGTFSNGDGPGKPVFANGYWYCSHPSLPSNNLDRMSGFHVGASSVTRLPGFPIVYDPVQTTNTSGNFYFGFRDQFFYSSFTGTNYSLHSRVVAADGSVSDPSVADKTAIHDFSGPASAFTFVRQGRMMAMLSSGAPFTINLFRSTLTDGQMEYYGNPNVPIGLTTALRLSFLLK